MVSASGRTFGAARRTERQQAAIFEQDHRGVKPRLHPMLVFKDCAYAATTIAGVELLHRLGKDQFALG
jgi:transposase-like protein